MKRVLLILLTIVVLLGAGGAFFLSRMDADFVVRRIAEATERATGAPLTLAAPPRLSLLPPGIRFGQARWSGEPDGNAVAVSLQGGMARLELAPLLSGNIVISELRLERPEADIRLAPAATAKGRGAGAPSGTAEAKSPARAAPDDALPFELGRLTVTQGALRLTDGGRRIVLSGFNLSLENLRRREEASLQGDLVLELGRDAPGAADAAPQLAGNLAFKGALRYYAPNLTFRQLSLAFTPLGGLIPRGLAPLQLTGEGALDLASLRLKLAEARLAAPQARLTLRGQGALAPPAFTGEARLTGQAGKLAALAGLAGPDGEADRLDLRSRVELTGPTLRLAGIGGEAAGVSFGGEVSVGLPTDAEQALSVRGALRLGTVDLGPWLAEGKAAGPAPARAGATKAPKAPAPGKEAPGGLPALDLRLTIAVLRHGAFALRDLSTRLTGAAGRYSLDGLTMRLATGGALQGSLSADLAQSAYSVTATGTGVDLGPLCAAAGHAGLVSGTAAFNARLRASGVESRALLASLEGEGLLEARDLSAPALAGAAAALKALPLRGLTVPDRIATLSAPFTARKGEITARPVTLAADALSARGEARVSLPREYLEGSATVSAAGLTIPLTFKGPFGGIGVSVDPKFALELGAKLGGIPGMGNAAGAAGSGAARGAGNAVRDGLGAAGGIVRGLLGR